MDGKSRAMRSVYQDVIAIVDSCGGPKRVADALSFTNYPVSIDAVRKWERYGIPSHHWRGLMVLNTKLTPWDLLLCNERCEMRPARIKKIRSLRGLREVRRPSGSRNSAR
jgi:hypothetical protein